MNVFIAWNVLEVIGFAFNNGLTALQALFLYVGLAAGAEVRHHQVMPQEKLVCC